MMRAKINPETTVKVARVYRVAMHRLFAAWTDPALLAQWWGPAAPPSSAPAGPDSADATEPCTHELIFDPKIGGEFHWVYNDSQGHLHTVNGEIREFVPREKILFTWIAVEGTPHFDHDDHHERDGRRRHTHNRDESRVTVDFREGQGVEVRVLHVDLPDRETRDALEAGWAAALERLHTLLMG